MLVFLFLLLTPCFAVNSANCYLKDVRLNEAIDCAINEEIDGLGSKLKGSNLYNTTFLPDHPYLCNVDTIGKLNNNTALIVKRGNCSFYEKAQNAEKLGASAVIIVNSVESYYNLSTQQILDPCELRCDYGNSYTTNITMDNILSGYKDNECSLSSSCLSHSCGLEDNKKGEIKRQLCCIDDDYIYLSRDRKQKRISIPVVFVVLENRDWFEISRIIEISKYKETFDDPSLALLLLAYSIVFFSCIFATSSTPLNNGLSSTELLKSSEMMSNQISTKFVVVYLVLCVLLLVGLFFLLKAFPKLVIILLYFLYCCGSIPAFVIVIQRIFTMFTNKNNKSKRWYLLIEIISYVIPIAVSFIFFFTRHYNFSWILQDMMGFFFVCFLLEFIKFPSLKSCTILLSIFFFYDIFMTFITPLIFGSSVMQDVATAGKETTNIIVENGMRICEFNEEERMPMLLLIPYHVRGKLTYTMLGLGDVALPSILLVYLLRFDRKNQTYCKGYFFISFIGYCFGLLFTFVAIVIGFEVNGVRGQPALLYIVPCILIPCLVVSYLRSQFIGLWNGSLIKFSSKTSECDPESYMENEGVEPNDHTSLLSNNRV